VAVGQDSSLSDDDRKAFAWYDGLGFPSCVGRPFVCLTRTSEKPTEGEEPWSTSGFLLAETPEAFTLIGSDVFPYTMERHSNGSVITKRPGALKSIAQEALDALRDQIRTGSRGAVLPGIGRLCMGPAHSLETPAEVFVLARRCAESGFEGLAADLLTADAKMIESGFYGKSTAGSLRACIAENIARSVHSKIVVEHGDSAVSRPRLLEEYREWLRLYPDSPLREKAEADARTLAAMVAEDAKHLAIPDDRLAALPVGQRIQELIYRLRDQQGGQWSNPGSPSIYGMNVLFGGTKKGETPAGRIEEIGMDAVPALIEALEDARFTRALGFHRMWSYSSYYVVRIGDAARELLENITGQVFWTPINTAGSMIKDGQAKETKERYLAWWKARKVAPPK
jgi:hypothetical protein